MLPRLSRMRGIEFPNRGTSDRSSSRVVAPGTSSPLDVPAGPAVGVAEITAVGMAVGLGLLVGIGIGVGV